MVLASNRNAQKLKDTITVIIIIIIIIMILEYYNDLKYEILKCWNKEVDKVMILPIVIGALGSVTNNVRKNLDKVDLHLGVDAIQKTCLLGTARILRKVLDTK